MSILWGHLAKPFRPGSVIIYQTGFAFSFCDATGETYHNRNVTYRTAAEAKGEMRKFVERENERKI